MTTESTQSRRMQAVEPLLCTNCYWVGGEEDLRRVKDAEDGEWSDACPNCLTDNFLMDTALDGVPDVPVQGRFVDDVCRCASCRAEEKGHD